jgi:hypothetical protein
MPIVAFSDLVKEELIQANQGNQNQLSMEQVEQLVGVTKTITILIAIPAVVFDFFFRFLVIDSLYHKYMEERIDGADTSYLEARLYAHNELIS